MAAIITFMVFLRIISNATCCGLGGKENAEAINLKAALSLSDQLQDELIKVQELARQYKAQAQFMQDVIHADTLKKCTGLQLELETSLKEQSRLQEALNGSPNAEEWSHKELEIQDLQKKCQRKMKTLSS